MKGPSRFPLDLSELGRCCSSPLPHRCCPPLKPCLCPSVALLKVLLQLDSDLMQLWDRLQIAVRGRDVRRKVEEKGHLDVEVEEKETSL